MYRRTSVIAVAFVTIGAVSSCSSSGSPSKSATTPTKSSSSPTTSFPSSSSSAATPAPSESVSAADLSTALLTPADLGLTGAASQASKQTDNPLPCAAAGSKSLNQQVPATVRVGVDISDDALQIGLSEEIRLFADETTSTAAVTAAVAGLNCTSGSLIDDGGAAVPITIQPPVDIKADLAKDTKLADVTITAAQVWQGTASGEDIDLVVVQLGRSVVLFSFQSGTGADTSKLPNPLTVVDDALEKIISS